MTIKQPSNKAKVAKATKAKITTKKQVKKQPVKSLVLSKSEKPFMTVNPDKQSLYWIILGLVVIGFSLWILQLQSDIDMLYNTISTNNESSLIKRLPKTGV